MKYVQQPSSPLAQNMPDFDCSHNAKTVFGGRVFGGIYHRMYVSSLIPRILQGQHAQINPLTTNDNYSGHPKFSS